MLPRTVEKAAALKGTAVEPHNSLSRKIARWHPGVVASAARRSEDGSAMLIPLIAAVALGLPAAHEANSLQHLHEAELLPKEYEFYDGNWQERSDDVQGHDNATDDLLSVDLIDESPAGRLFSMMSHEANVSAGIEQRLMSTLHSRVRVSAASGVTAFSVDAASAEEREAQFLALWNTHPYARPHSIPAPHS